MSNELRNGSLDLAMKSILLNDEAGPPTDHWSVCAAKDKPVHSLKSNSHVPEPSIRFLGMGFKVYDSIFQTCTETDRFSGSLWD
eukprot:4959909-Amphidinium_carterae.1